MTPEQLRAFRHATASEGLALYRTTGAVRDVGKALGLSEDLIKILS